LFISITALVHRLYMDRAARISGQLAGHERRVQDDWVVILDQAHHPVRVIRAPAGQGYRVECAGQEFAIQTDWTFGQRILRATVNGVQRVFQVRRSGMGYCIRHRGRTICPLVMTPSSARLYQLMPVQEQEDRTRQVLSPMPGLLVRLWVSEGEEVKAGQDLAVIEAMKMENVLKAEVDGVIATIHCQRGDSLDVDQIILEFE